jgi:hypothetical protein
MDKISLDVVYNSIIYKEQFTLYKQHKISEEEALGNIINQMYYQIKILKNNIEEMINTTHNPIIILRKDIE